MSEQDTFFCIYSGRDWPAQARSVEHIIPFALGGSDRLVTPDVARKLNNDLGTKLDAVLLQDLRVVLHRQRLGIKSEKGHVPTLVLRGTASLDTEEVKARLSLGPDGELSLRLLASSITEDGDRVLIKARHLDEVEGLIARARAKVEKRGQKVASVGEISYSRTTKAAEFVGKYDCGVCDMRQSMVKIAIGAAHYVLGYSWSKSAGADRLRTCLHATSTSTLNSAGVVGPQFGISKEGAFERMWSLGPDSHLISIYNHPLGLLCVILLFGDLLGVVKLADDPWAGPELGSEGTVLVVDCKTRDMRSYSLDEFALERARAEGRTSPLE